MDPDIGKQLIRIVRKFERDGVQDFSMTKCGCERSFEGSSKKRIEVCKNKDGILCYSRAIQGYSGGIPSEPQLMGSVKNSTRLSSNFQSILGKGLLPGGKEKDKAPQAVFLTPTSPLADDPEEEEPHDDFRVPQKASMLRNGSMTRTQCAGYDCQRRRIKD